MLHVGEGKATAQILLGAPTKALTAFYPTGQAGQDDVGETHTGRPLFETLQGTAGNGRPPATAVAFDLCPGPYGPPIPFIPPTPGEKAAAEQLITQMDAHAGKGLLNTQLEKDLLHHWLQGTGKTYELSSEDMNTLAQTQDVQTVGRVIATDGPAAAGRTVQLNGYSTTITPVTLENGQRGYRADLNFNTDQPGAGNEAFDGAIGKGRVYFDEQGNLVGVLDSYDFSNDNIFVDGINAVGAKVGARNFELRGGVIEQSPDLVVPEGPDLLSSAGGVGRRVVEKAGDVVGDMWDRVWG